MNLLELLSCPSANSPTTPSTQGSRISSFPGVSQRRWACCHAWRRIRALLRHFSWRLQKLFQRKWIHGGLRCDLPYRQVRSFGPPGPARRSPRPRRLEECSRRSEKNGSRADSSSAAIPTADASPACFAPKSLNRLGTPAALLPAASAAQARATAHPAPARPAHANPFRQGTRDPFGSIAEIERALKMIPAKTKLMIVEGAGHDLGFKGKSRNEALLATVLVELQS